MNMDEQKKSFERYPLWIVFVTNLVSLSVYFVGFYLTYQITPIFSLLFLFYLIYVELSIYREGCVFCYYYGKMCAFGRGKIAKFLLKKGDPRKFYEKEVSFKDFIPQMIVSIIPLSAGIYLLFKDFRWPILGLTIWPVIVWMVGYPNIFGRLV